MRLRCALSVLALLALPACRGEQKLHSTCVDNPGTCSACTTDAECIIDSNQCLADAYCTHRDNPVAVIQIGCSSELEYDKPPPQKCACIQSVCRAR